MKKLFSFAMGLLTAVLINTSPANAEWFDGRYYIIDPPRNCARNEAPDLVVAFHGAGSYASTMRTATQFHNQARCTVVVHPQATTANERTWNAHHGRFWIPAEVNNSPDVEYTISLIQWLSARYGVERVFLSGISNGCKLAYEIAAHHPEVVDGVGVVNCFWESLDTVGPASPVPLIHISGMDDNIVPWEGGAVHYDTITPPVIEGIDRMRVANGCFGYTTADPVDAWQRNYAGCEAATSYRRVPGMGHINWRTSTYNTTSRLLDAWGIN